MSDFRLTSEINERTIKQEINKIIKKNNKTVYLLLDGDKTFSKSDGTIKFCEYADVSFNIILEFFKNYDYSFENFYRVARFYSSIDYEKYTKASEKSARHVVLYEEFVRLIKKYRKKVAIIVVTAGVKLLWEKILAKNGLDFVYLLGGNYLKRDKYIVDKRSKGQIVNLLKNHQKKVIVFGDSLVDGEMLKNADHSFLVVNKNMNNCIANSGRIDFKKISQISFNGKYHKHINKKTIKDVEFYIKKYIGI